MSFQPCVSLSFKCLILFLFSTLAVVVSMMMTMYIPQVMRMSEAIRRVHLPTYARPLVRHGT